MAGTADGKAKERVNRQQRVMTRPSVEGAGDRDFRSALGTARLESGGGAKGLSRGEGIVNNGIRTVAVQWVC